MGVLLQVLSGGCRSNSQDRAGLSRQLHQEESQAGIEQAEHAEEEIDAREDEVADAKQPQVLVVQQALPLRGVHQRPDRRRRDW